MDAAEDGNARRRLATRRRIVESADELFRELGYRPTSVAMIARKAEVSDRTFYVHFESKEAVLFAHADDYFEHALHVATQSPAGTGGPERVEAALAAMIDMMTSDERLSAQAALRVSVASRGMIPPTLLTKVQDFGARLAAVVAEGSADAGHGAPMIGAALGAVVAAGFSQASRTRARDESRDAMRAALRAALAGFRAEESSPAAHTPSGLARTPDHLRARPAPASAARRKDPRP